MPEHQEESGEDETSTDAEKETASKAGLFAALLDTFHDLQISLQNILTIIAIFVIPFVVNVVGASIALGIAISLCVIVWFLLFKALPRVKSRMSAFTLGGVLTVLLIASGIRVGSFQKPSAQLADAQPNSKIVTAEPPPQPKRDRIFVPADIDVKYLTGLRNQDIPSIQAEKLAANYIGRWMTISMTVRDIENFYEPGSTTVAVGAWTASDPGALLLFAPNWHDRIAMLRKGSKFSAFGKIRTVGPRYVTLEDCEIGTP